MLDLNQRPKDYEAAPDPFAHPINKGYATHAEENLEPSPPIVTTCGVELSYVLATRGHISVCFVRPSNSTALGQERTCVTSLGTGSVRLPHGHTTYET